MVACVCVCVCVCATEFQSSLIERAQWQLATMVRHKWVNFTEMLKYKSSKHV